MRRGDLYLRRIHDETAFLREIGKELTYDGLLADPVRQRAVVRSIEIIGEATKNISEPLKEQHPEIPWRLIAGSRDKLIHAYFDVDWRNNRSIVRELTAVAPGLLRTEGGPG